MEILRKQILYRSTHRGCKETDFLIGEFAKVNLNNIVDLELFSRFLEEDDLEIYDWILAKYQEPDHYKSIVGEIRKFYKISTQQ